MPAAQLRLRAATLACACVAALAAAGPPVSAAGATAHGRESGSATVTPSLSASVIPSPTPRASATAARARAGRLSPASVRSRLRAKHARLWSPRTVEFGIYPGGAAGAVNARGEPRPEVPALRQRALEQLRGRRPLVVHLYEAYTSPADAARVPDWLAEQIAEATGAGLRVELVLRYRPARGADVPGFAAFVRARVAQLGADRRIVALQITNEVNVGAAPDAADGAYPQAVEALVAGVRAARSEVRRRGFAQLSIGFNIGDEPAAKLLPLFTKLRVLGGRPFARAVDWVGIDAYPGTWGPPLVAGVSLDEGVRRATRATLRRLRRTLLPEAGLATVPLIVAESGYPTDAAGRTEQDQVVAMRAMIETIARVRRSYGVVGYRWFDLRDADSSVGSFESQYGLMRDDYAPKLGFGVYRSLIARYG